jgi:hypothetical protein
MSDFSTTTNFALKKPTVGQAVDSWGTYLNANFDEIDQQLQTLTVSITTPDLEDLGNVLADSPSINQYLQFNGTNWTAATVSIPSSIDDLSDVDTSTTSPTTNQVLTWNGSKFVPASPSDATIADGSITTGKLDSGLQTQLNRILVTDDADTPTNGQIVQYNSTDAVWEYADLPGSTVVTLSDVNSAALANDALLVYNSTAGEFQFESGATLRTTLGVDPIGTDNSTDLSISSATSYDYIVLSAGQVLTINQVDLQTDVANTLPVSSGGTGSTTVSAARTALGLGTISTQDSDDVTITGGTISGIVDLAIADGGTGASSVSAARSNLGLGTLATQDTITESQISDLGSYITASSTDTLTNKSGNISMFTNDAGYLTAETNDLSNVSGTLAIANGGTGSSSAATARVALLPSLTGNGSKLVAVNSGATDVEYIATSTLSITESQIADLQTYLTASSTATLTNKSGNISQWTNDAGYLTAESNNLSTVSGTLGTANGGTGLTAIGTANQVLAVNSGATALEFQTLSLTEVNDLTASVTWSNVPDANITQSSVTQHQAALSITESQISDLQSYLTAETNDLGSAVTGTLGTANGGTGLTSIGTAGQVLTVNSGATALEYQTPSTGIMEVDQWYLTANVGGPSADITTNWARNNFTGFSKIGIGLTEAAGIFTFPRTGVYEIISTFNFRESSAGSDPNVNVILAISTDNGSNFSNVNIIRSNHLNDGYRSSSTSPYILNVNSISGSSTVKIKFLVDSINTGNLIMGGTSLMESNFVVKRLGPAQ